jgi:hypothetical protein
MEETGKGGGGGGVPLAQPENRTRPGQRDLSSCQQAIPYLQADGERERQGGRHGDGDEVEEVEDRGPRTLAVNDVERHLRRSPQNEHEHQHPDEPAPAREGRISSIPQGSFKIFDEEPTKDICTKGLSIPDKVPGSIGYAIGGTRLGVRHTSRHRAGSP